MTPETKAPWLTLLHHALTFLCFSICVFVVVRQVQVEHELATLRQSCRIVEEKVQESFGEIRRQKRSSSSSRAAATKTRSGTGAMVSLKIERAEPTSEDRSKAFYFPDHIEVSAKTLTDVCEGLIGSCARRCNQTSFLRLLHGIKGDKGDRGERGMIGLTMKGDKGDRGDKGDKGDRGLLGLTGSKGDMGPMGHKGAKGESVIGEKGDPGEAGQPGPVGPAGPAGERGEPGYCLPSNCSSSGSSSASVDQASTSQDQQDEKPREKKPEEPLYHRSQACYMKRVLGSEYLAYGDSNVATIIKDSRPAQGKENALMVLFGANSSSLQEYQSVEHFRNRRFTLQTLPFPAIGTGSVAHNDFLFYHSLPSNNLVRYHMADASSGRKESYQTWLLNDCSTEFPLYTSASGSFVDLSVDEHGLWVTCRSVLAPQKVSVQLVDLNTLSQRRSWTLDLVTNDYQDSFIMCGVLYLAKSAHSEIRIDLAYDVFESRFVPFRQTFFAGYMNLVMLQFNQRDFKLYAWSNGNAQAFPVSFQQEFSNDIVRQVQRTSGARPRKTEATAMLRSVSSSSSRISPICILNFCLNSFVLFVTVFSLY